MKRLTAILLAGLLMIAFWAGCGPSISDREKMDDSSPDPTEASDAVPNDNDQADKPTDAPDNTVKGKWVLTKEDSERTRDEYQGREFTSVYTNDLYEHRYESKYEPDPNDPADGPTPYSAAFDCSCMLPDTLYPGDTARFTLVATVDYDDKPGSNGGICCSLTFFGLNPEPKINSKKGYNYSDSMYYPVYAGCPNEYGHMNDKYESGMNDFIDVTMPKITPEMNPRAYSEMTVTFSSSAGDSVFVYTWVDGE